MRRTVITGMGVVSTLGCDLDTVSASLRAGRCGLVRDEERVKHGFSSPLTGALLGWDGGKRLDRKARKSMAEPALYAVAAALAAIDDCGLPLTRFASPDVAVILGNDSTVVSSSETVDKARAAGYTAPVGSGAIFQVMTSTATMNLSTLLGTQGANWTIAAACASGAHAVGQGMVLLGAGLQEIALVGGTQELGWQSMLAFDALGAFSRRVDTPALASRPFDRDRDGLVPSGGAAVLVLETYEGARARGARIHGELCGYAFNANGHHLTQPSVEGPAACMRMALQRAGLRPDEIDYISAHATSTPIGDLMEGRALLEVFGPNGPPVSSTKSMTGHECWMSGASELVYSALMMRDGFLAPNVNLDTLDPELAGLNVVRETRAARPRAILSNAFGFGGTNSALVLRSV